MFWTLAEARIASQLHRVTVHLRICNERFTTAQPRLMPDSWGIMGDWDCSFNILNWIQFPIEEFVIWAKIWIRGTVHCATPQPRFTHVFSLFFLPFFGIVFVTPWPFICLCWFSYSYNTNWPPWFLLLENTIHVLSYLRLCLLSGLLCLCGCSVLCKRIECGLLFEPWTDWPW